MWDLFTVGSLQFSSDSTIASEEANQNRPKRFYERSYSVYRSTVQTLFLN